MKYEANTLEEYLDLIPKDRKDAIIKLKNTISDNLPVGFSEKYSDSFIQFVVPLEIYPDGYHCTKDEPLPFIAIASQKHFIALYHMGVYAFDDILNWFVQEYPKHSKTKLDMGKSCIRFKKVDQIP